jgi:SAM-dependent methyltransferase
MSGAALEPYAVYAHFYDATQASSKAAQYRYLLRRHHPAARTLLELGCGTGAHLAHLSTDYAVEGLDLSRTMLRYARRALPAVTFHRQDMAGFSVRECFDAIVCPYDSINHLLRFGDWVRTFRAAKRHLNPNGVFIFDANTEHRLRELARTPSWIHRFGDNFLVMAVSLANKGVFEWDIKVFEHLKRQTYRLHREVIRERAFENDRVVRALRSHFGSVRTYDPAGWSRPKKASPRLFYVCR